MAFTTKQLEALSTINRRAYTEAQIEEALQYQIDQQCSMKEVAETFGISTQTLSNRRDALLVAAGLKAPKGAKVKKASKKAAKA